MVHFVASDAHDLRDRTPDLSNAYNHVRVRFGLEAADRLFVANPSTALGGDVINSADGTKSGRLGWLSRFLR
jgi:protein-tyrosine phosphatase